MTWPTYHSVNVDGLDVFYREAGNSAAPTLLLLHGFPTSSHMFRDLIPLLSDRFHLVAPDLPGFGHTSLRPRDTFNYTFANLAKVIDRFTEVIGLDRFSGILFSATGEPQRMQTVGRSGNCSRLSRSAGSIRMACPTHRSWHTTAATSIHSI
jgi:alpha-beta hydrolase superfamily lysophospholipase